MVRNPLEGLTPFQRKVRVTLHQILEYFMGKRSCTGTYEQRYKAYVLRHNYDDTFEEYMAYKALTPEQKRCQPPGTALRSKKLSDVFGSNF